MKIIEIIRHYARAWDVISSWLKEGASIVRPQIAHKRFQICAACPLYIKSGMFASIVSKYIRWRVESKNKISLAIPNVVKIGQCSACGCPLDSKLWMPIEKIKPADSERRRFDEDCWLFKMH